MYLVLNSTHFCEFFKNIFYIEREIAIMNIIANIYTYTNFAALMLANNKELQKNFILNVVENLHILNEDTDTKKYLSRLQKHLIANLNTFIRENNFSPKEKSYLKDLRNYFMQVKNLLINERESIKPNELLLNLNNTEFKAKLNEIAENSPIRKGKLKNKKTGEVFEYEIKSKNANLNFFDKKYTFTYKIRKK